MPSDRPAARNIKGSQDGRPPRGRPWRHATITSHEAARRGEREPLWTLFKVVLGLSALSWGGLALMAQLENHYVEREAGSRAVAFSDLIALAWMVPGPVGCNVAVQLGHALRGRAGAWVAGIASVLPFFMLMTLFAIFYRTPLVRTFASQTLLNHFSVVLATLIGITWYKQTRALVRGKLEWTAAVVGCFALFYAHSPAAYVLMLSAAFGAGWVVSPVRNTRFVVSFPRGDWQILAMLCVFVLLFALPLPHRYDLALLWPRLAGAGMTLFGGGFSALPVLKTLFVTPTIGVSDNDFTLAFSLSPISPGPLLNVVPFFGYLVDGWAGRAARHARAVRAVGMPRGAGAAASASVENEPAIRAWHADSARRHHRVPRGGRAAYRRTCAAATGLSADRACSRRCASRSSSCPCTWCTAPWAIWRGGRPGCEAAGGVRSATVLDA